MRSLALITPGPTWTDGRPVFTQDATILAGHLGAMGRLFDRRVLLLGGPVSGGRSGVALFDTDTVDDASRHLGEDPAVRSGLFRFTIHQLDPYFDAFDGTRRPLLSGPSPEP